MRSDFILGLHIMGFLTAVNDRPISSQTLAETYGTNPVVIRRILGKLNEAGLVKSQRGVGGGSILTQDPTKISLRDIYEAVTESTELLPRYPENEGGPSEILSSYVNNLLDSAEGELLTQLSKTNISEMDKRVRSTILKIINNESRKKGRKSC